MKSQPVQIQQPKTLAGEERGEEGEGGRGESRTAKRGNWLTLTSEEARETRETVRVLPLSPENVATTGN